jgi:hypothetical protein
MCFFLSAVPVSGYREMGKATSEGRRVMNSSSI